MPLKASCQNSKPRLKKNPTDLQKVQELVVLQPLFSPDGGIGRHAGLKNPYREMCRFDPGSGYKYSKDPNL